MKIQTYQIYFTTIYIALKLRNTEEFLCQFALLPCRFFRGRRQGRQPLNPGAGPRARVLAGGLRW